MNRMSPLGTGLFSSQQVNRMGSTPSIQDQRVFWLAVGLTVSSQGDASDC